MELERSLIEAIEVVKCVIYEVPEQYRQDSYPILLSAAIHRNHESPVAANVVESNLGAHSDSYRDMFGRPANELLARVQPERMIDAVMLLCAHLDVRAEPITAEFARKLFEQTKRATPKNIADMLSRLVKRGFLTTVDKQGRSTVYEITSLGREFVNGQLEETSGE